jgi:hypothetical protein
MAQITVNSTAYTNIHFAYFAKPKGVASGVNQLKDSLNVGDIEINSYVDKKMEYTYFRRIKNILGNPKVEAKMTLPLSVFQSFEFNQFVYLKHKDLQGYFFVEKIDNYKDAKTPVKVYLLYID